MRSRRSSIAHCTLPRGKAGFEMRLLTLSLFGFRPYLAAAVQGFPSSSTKYNGHFHTSPHIVDEDLISVTCRPWDVVPLQKKSGVLPTECKIPSGTKAPPILPAARLPRRVCKNPYLHNLHAFDKACRTRSVLHISRMRRLCTTRANKPVDDVRHQRP